MDLYISEEHLEALYEEFGRGNDNYILLIEEMSELAKALTKRIRYPGKGEITDSIIEEMAHVYICLEAVARLEGISEDDIQFEIYKKENR